MTLQNLEPPVPADETMNIFDANDIEWHIYDIGPRDGSTIMARGTFGPITVLVSTQGPFGESSPTQPVTEAIARFLVIEPLPSS